MARFMTNFIVRLIKAFLPKGYCVLRVADLYMIEGSYRVTEAEIKQANFPNLVTEHGERSAVAKLTTKMFDDGLIRIEKKKHYDGFLQMDVTDIKATVRVIKPTNL